MKPKVNDIIELTIDRLTYNGGRGIGRLNNFAIFVQGATAPGDFTQAKIIQVKKNHAIAQLVKIIEPSLHRIEPPCEYFKSCGGCQWQHLTYDEQIKQKTEFILFTLKKLNITLPVNFLNSDNKYNYRNRIQLNYLNKQLGYFQNYSNSHVPIKECKIANQKINGLISNFNPIDQHKRYEFALTVNGDANYYPVNKKDPHNLFSQVNNDINGKLIELVLNEIHPDYDQTIYDAYCGSGNFTYKIKNKAPLAKVIGIDFSRSNILKTQDNHSNIKFINAKVENYFRKNPAPHSSLTLLDPPRAGCDESLFKNICSEKIIYISCDLSTFERDARRLINQGYKMQKITGLDMFPQTYHLETFSVFIKDEDSTKVNF